MGGGGLKYAIYGCGWMWSSRVRTLWPFLHNASTGIVLRRTSLVGGVASKHIGRHFES